MKRALVILFDKVEEIEALAPVDILRRARVDVTTAAVGESKTVYGRSGVPIEADELFSKAKAEDFDAVVLAGGPGTFDIIDDPELLDFLKSSNGKGRVMCAICAAPAVFDRAGIIGARKCASHPSVAELLPTRQPDLATVCDGNLITSQGAGTAVEFALSIVSDLLGGEKSAEIAKSICFKS